MSNRPLVSVVIIGRNEGERLRRCIRSVLASDPPSGEVELIYVDSGSTDESVECARNYGATVLQAGGDRPTAARGRNAGWRVAHGRFVLFLDGDTILQRGFIQKAIAAMEHDVVAVWGHRRELDPGRSVYIRVLDLDWIYRAGDTEFCGGDVLMRTEALARAGGFDDSLIAGEEPELCSRLRAAGGVIRHIDVPMTLHDLAIDRLSAYWRRAFRCGHAYAEISARCRSGAIRLWSRESRRNFLHGSMVALFPLLLATAALAQPWFAACLLAGAAGLVVRTALRCGWKSPDPGTRLLYAVHSHFQQLPILCGQLAWHLDRTTNRQRGLIEYKAGGPQ